MSEWAEAAIIMGVLIFTYVMGFVHGLKEAS
jgi:hypothetical protein